jgi:hypothetical protein
MKNKIDGATALRLAAVLDACAATIATLRSK